MYIFILIITSNFSLILLAYFIESIAFAIKAIAESSLLYDSVPHSGNRSKIFSKIDGKASAYFYIFEAISCATTGYMYAINPYIPMCFCLAFCVIATVLSYRFKEIPHSADNGEPSNLKEYLKGIRYSFRYILKSNRLKSLILFCRCLLWLY